MNIILSLYVLVLALAVWQDRQGASPVDEGSDRRGDTSYQ